MAGTGDQVAGSNTSLLTGLAVVPGVSSEEAQSLLHRLFADLGCLVIDSCDEDAPTDAAILIGTDEPPSRGNFNLEDIF